MSTKNKFKKIAIIKAIALVSFASAVSAGGGNPSVSLAQTVGTDVTPGACGTSTVIAVTAGTQVNFCYSITNDGDEVLSLHDLDTSAFGPLLSGVSYDLMLGETLIVNDVRTLSSDVINDATWSASQNQFNVTVLTGVDFVFNDISGTGAPLGLTDEGNVGITMPFTIDYFGTTSDEITIGSNGAAIFGTLLGDVDFNPLPLPTAAPDNFAMVAPFWKDFDAATTPGSNQYSETVGVAPDREFIVQWDQVGIWNGVAGEDVTFQMALYEGSNEIQFRYLDVIFGGTAAAGDGGGDASIGLDSGDESNAYQYSLNGSTPVVDMSTVSFVPAPLPIFSASDSSQTAVGIQAPQVDISPGAIDTNVDNGGIGSEVLTIGNTGEGSLNWNVDEATSDGHEPRPVSNYQPISSYSEPTGAEVAPMSKSPVTNFTLEGGSTAFAYDVRNGNFGGITHTAPGDFGIVVASARAMFAGDFVNSDFSTLYAIDNDDRSLYAVDVGTGVETLVALTTPDTTGETIGGITQGPTSPTVYVGTTNGANSFLYTMDIVTAVLTPVGEVTNSALLIDIAMSPSGELFGLDIGSDSLIAIDTVTGAGTVVGALGVDVSFAQGLDFDDATNTLYMTGYIGGGVNEVRTIDTLTGASTLVGSVNELTGGAELDAFAIATSSDTCFSPSDIPWMSLSATSGVVGAGDTDDVTVNFDAAGLTNGIYEAKVCVFSNDPDEGFVSVPVTMQVGPDDLIFATGFETPAP